jgi:alpha-tubulin suppressor-like RCC1 family protein
MAQAIDPDNDPVTITASGLATASLPDSAKFNPKTGLFSWTPAFNQTGTFSIVFSASDGNLTAKDTTTIIVKKTDRAPVFNAIPATLTGAEGSVLKQYVKATDPDGDAVTLATVGAPFTKGATIVSDTLSWTPGYSDSGTYQVSFIASDGILYDTVTITVKIANTNRPPVATAQSVNAGRNTAKTIILSATDPDGDPIAQFKITKVASNGTATLSDQVAGTVVYTPNQGFIGVDTFSFSASDGTLWSLTSANVTVTVDSNKVAPQITTEPRIDTTINQGGTFTITVATNNAFPSPAYLWYQGIKGSGTLKGTTSNPVYSKVGVAAADSGNYYVIVSNTSGADTSSYSHITVDVPPSIVTGPVAPGAKCQGDSITLGVTASGTPPLSYQWQLAGNNITGAIAASYHIASISSANAGIYTCAVSNVCGASAAASTQGVTLTVNTASTAPNGATANPTTICSGSSSSLSVNGGSLGTGASWKWYTDAACSMPVTGTNTGTPISVSPTSNTTYYVRAEGGCGSTAAASATVTLNAASTAPTSATASPTNICSGGTSSLSVNGGTLGSGATWKWYTDAACSIPVTGNNTGTPITVSPTSNTTYYVRADGTCGPTTAASVTVTLNIAPAITTQPVQDNLWPTQTSASFSVAGSGTGLTYQWLRRPHNGTPANISGANSATYTFAPVKATNDQDKYSCQITNTCGTITSNEVLLNYIQANSVAPGYGFTLFLCTDAGVANGVWAVGNNAFGQLGDGTTTSKSAPVRVMASSGVPLTGVTAIAAGGNFSMFLLSDGSVWTCGDNSSGQLGIGTTIASSSYPVKVTGISNAIHIAAGYKHSVFQTSDVAPIYTCGDNTYGQGGYGSQGMTYSPINVTVSTAYLAGGTQDNISAGDYHTVVYSSYDAKAYACGLNTSGQLGDGTTTNRTSFVQMPQMPGYASSIGTGANHTMEYGSNYTWMCGNNASGQLGNNSTVSAKTPVDISSSLSGYSWMVFAGGSNHSLFWDNATTLMACGDNSKGQLGIGSTTNSLVPTAISFTGSIAQVAARSNSSFILTTDGRVYGFGDNSNGQLGDKTTTNHTSPTWITW